MKVKINKLVDYKNKIIDLMKEEYVQQGQILNTKLSLESKKQLQRTLKFATPRGERGNGGFGGAAPLIIKSLVKKTAFGATVFVQVQMIDKRTSKLHRVWHLISSGTNGLISKKRYVYRLRKNVRTHTGNLDVDPFSGFTGEYRTMKKGGRIADIVGRRYYETAVDEVMQNIENGLFDFIREEGNENE